MDHVITVAIRETFQRNMSIGKRILFIKVQDRIRIIISIMIIIIIQVIMPTMIMITTTVMAATTTTTTMIIMTTAGTMDGIATLMTIFVTNRTNAFYVEKHKMMTLLLNLRIDLLLVTK